MRTRIGLRVAVVLALLGTGFLIAAKVTPWHTNSDAYFAAISGLAENGDFEGASAAFRAAQAKYGTPKWLFADIAYALLAWAGVMAALGVAVRAGGLRRLALGSRRWWVLAPLATAAAGLLLIGEASAIIFQPLNREQVPWWSDSAGIPLAFVIGNFALFLPTVLLLTLAPLAVRGPPAPPLMTWRGRSIWRTTLFSAIYAPTIIYGLMLLTPPWSTGAWALGPSGALLIWLSLNGRALGMGVPESLSERPS
jgi:hypothetical protein